MISHFLLLFMGKRNILYINVYVVYIMVKILDLKKFILLIKTNKIDYFKQSLSLGSMHEVETEYIVLMCLMPEIHSEKCVVRGFHHCMNITEYTYTSLNGVAYDIPRLSSRVLLLLCCKPTQHITTVLNIAGNVTQWYLYI